MKRITEIHINNFRAFYGEQKPIELPKGENLLIYGENGSGKSSLYRALEDFFQSSQNTTLDVEENIFDLKSKNGYVNIRFADFEHIKKNDGQQELSRNSEGDVYKFGMQHKTTQISFLKDSNKLRLVTFLTYKSLLKTYNPEHHEQRVNLFSLIVNEICAHHMNPLITEREEIKRFGETFGEEWKQLKNLPQLKRGTKKYEQLKDPLRKKFNNGLRQVLREVEDELQVLLDEYFKNHIKVKFAFPDIEYYDKIKKEFGEEPHISLNIQYFGQDISSFPYHTFLNEARLSALAIAIYFASLLRIPPDVEYKLLFLDDIFIGLDMSNRMPLLRIIQELFVKDQGFQVFLTTYDRQWFHWAKQWFNSHAPQQWKYLEMYVNDTAKNAEGQRFEQPEVVESKAHMAKVWEHLQSPNPDYPAAANYLRKEAEDLLQSLFPKIMQKGDDGIDISTLRGRVDLAITLLKKIGKDPSLLIELTRYLDRLMNPLSHSETDLAIYRSDLLEAINLLNEIAESIDLSDVKIDIVLPQKSLLQCELKYLTDGKSNHVIIDLKTDDHLWLYKEGESDSRFFYPPCSSDKYTEIKAEGNFQFYQKIPFQELDQKIREHLERKEAAESITTIYKYYDYKRKTWRSLETLKVF